MVKYDVITVGSATIDVFIDTDSELIKIKTSKGEEDLIAYPSGSKILIKKIQFLTGGGGTNTAVSLSRLGLKVAYLGKLGNDDNAKKILGQLQTDKVFFLGSLGPGQTGYSVILDSLEQDRTILTYKGENDDMSICDVDYKKLKTKWFYFSSMVRSSFQTLEKIAEYAEKNKIKILFNPSNYLAERGPDYLSNILSRTEILVLNKEEAELLSGKGDIKDMILRLKKLGPKQVLITDGKNGAYTSDEKYFYHVAPLKKVTVKETTGAGDAFASSFLAGMIKRKNIEFALKLAIVNSSTVIQGIGAKTNLLKYSKALNIIRKSRIKIEKKKSK
jgi:ribokinase